MSFLATLFGKRPSANCHHLAPALHRCGTVLQRIPGNTTGSGEIEIDLEGARKNIPAYTWGSEIPVGTAIWVLAQHGPDALLVEPLS